MSNRRRAALLAAAATACLPLAAQAAPWTPSTLFAPYVDMSSWPTPSLSALSSASGTNNYTLAFITASPTDAPAWGGLEAYDTGSGQLDAGINSGIATLRANGGNAGISFGGQTGTDLANVVSNVATLQSDYQSVLNTYNVHRVDFDIEGTDPANTTAVANRFTAIGKIQKAAPAATPLAVTLTLPVEPTIGLDPTALNVVQSAITHGVTLSSINIMTMQFGDFYAPPGGNSVSPTGDMGDYVINAAQTTFSQLKTLYAQNGIAKTDAQIYAMIGITPMIGQNSADETFTTADADKVGMWAAQHQVGLLSFWLATRDHPGTGDATNSETNSGIAQTDYQFAGIFQKWANAIPGDANHDGVVNFADFITLSDNFGKPNVGWSGGDFNGDGVTNFADFIILSNNFGDSIAGGPDAVTANEIAQFHAETADFGAPSSVPEPASIALLALAALPLLTRRKR